MYTKRYIDVNAQSICGCHDTIGSHTLRVIKKKLATDLLQKIHNMSGPILWHGCHGFKQHSTRLVFSARKPELHWLRVPEMIKFRICVLAFRCLHGKTPRYLDETLHLTTSCGSCSRPRSAVTPTLIVPATWRRNLGYCTFPAAAARAWNSLTSLSEMNSHWQPFDTNWRQCSSGHPLARMLMPEPRHC